MVEVEPGMAEKREMHETTLTFHQRGRYKWQELKLNYTLSEVRSPTAEAVEQVRGQFRAAGLVAF